MSQEIEKCDPWYPEPGVKEPERNGPCPCGSDKKFKKCCRGNVKPAPRVKERAFVPKDHHYDFDTIPTMEEMRGQFNGSTQGTWRQGMTTHHVVMCDTPNMEDSKRSGDAYWGNSYRIGDYHHGSDGWFATMAHAWVPWALDEIETLRAELAALKGEKKSDD